MELCFNKNYLTSVSLFPVVSLDYWDLKPCFELILIEKNHGMMAGFLAQVI